MLFAREHVPETESRLPADDKELLGLRVVVMAATRDAGVGGEERKLPGVGRLQHLHENAARVAMHGHAVGEGFCGQETHVGAVERAGEAGAHTLAHQGLAAFAEGLDLCGEFTYRRAVDRRDLAEARALAASQGLQHRQPSRDDVVDVNQTHRRGWVVDSDRQATCDVVAKGGHGRVVVRPAPLAEDVGQAPDVDRRTGAMAMRAHSIFRSAFAGAVGVVAVGLSGRT